MYKLGIKGTNAKWYWSFFKVWQLPLVAEATTGGSREATMARGGLHGSTVVARPPWPCSGTVAAGTTGCLW